MREIKFRAWDIKEKRFLESFNKNYLEDGFEGTVITNEDAGCGCCFEDVSHEVEIMQFSGLKDKNGVDIYEGDIVKTETGGHWDSLTRKPTTVISEVKYNERNGYSRLFGGIHPILWEVIGNIYENKELLEESK